VIESQPGSTRKRVQVLLLACVLLPGCAGMRRTRERNRVDALIAETEALADAGDLAGAIARVEAQLPEVEDDFRLRFALGWYQGRLAGRSMDEERREHLAAAVRQYDAALELRPGHFDAGANKALALVALGEHARALEVASGLVAAATDDERRYAALVFEGDILADPDNAQGDADAALARYREAYQLDPRDDVAPLRTVDLKIRLASSEPGGAHWREDLFVTSIDLHLVGFERAASAGFLALVRLCAEKALSSLVRWVEVEGQRRAFSAESLELLPPGEACPDLAELLEELRGLALEPAARAEGLVAWRRELPRRHAAALALQTLARASVLDGRPIEEAIAIHEAALGIHTRKPPSLNGHPVPVPLAPPPEAYDPGGELEGRPDVGLDIAVDLLLLLHENAGELDPDRTRIWNLVTKEPLRGFAHQLASGELASRERARAERQRARTALGLVMGELFGWKSIAQLELEEALRVAGEEPAVELPGLYRTIGDGLADPGPPVGAVDAYREAVRRYLDEGSALEARAVFEPARKVAQRTESEFYELDRLLHPTKGWYMGAALGVTEGSSTAQDVGDDLRAAGADVEVELDDNDFGARVYGGYRFARPFAVELGFTSLAGPSSSVVEQAPGDDLVAKVAAAHPVTGEGITAAALWLPYESRRFALHLKGGAWFWVSDIDVEVTTSDGTTSTTELREDGVDPLLGLGLQYRVSHPWILRLEYERYFLQESDFIDMLSLGFLVKL